MEPILLERGDRVFLITPVTPFTPTAEQIEEYAFSKDLVEKAPNPRLYWLSGQYVEADTPNENKAMWRSGDLAIAALSPMFCPVTVMHDPRTAVGLIADTKLLTPEKDGVPRAKIDTTLAIWAHRFPEIVQECEINSEAGTLMQSMECFSPHYDCSECGRTYHKLPNGEERANWCGHLKGEDGAQSARILGGVSFTGSGLIFGTRGARGADPKAHLEVEEVAAAHSEFHRQAGNTKPPRRKFQMETIEIAKSEYDRLTALAAKIDEETAKSADLTRNLEVAEAAKVKAEGERDAATKRADDAEKAVSETKLRDDRMGSLGTGFVAKLGDKTKERLQEQAGSFSEEDWASRLDEVEELVGVKRDAASDEKAEDKDKSKTAGTFTKEEVARSGVTPGDSPDDAADPSPEARRSVVAGLFPSKTAATTKS